MFKDREAVLPIDFSLYNKILGSDRLDIRAYRVCTFSELQHMATVQKTPQVFKVLDNPSFTDFTRCVISGNGALVEVVGWMDWDVPPGHLYGPDSNNRFWVNITKIKESLYKRGEKQSINRLSEIEKHVDVERDKTIKMATNFGSATSINEMLVSMEIDAKSVNKIMERFRGRQENLTSKWQLLGEILQKAESGRKDLRGMIPRLRNMHQLGLLHLTSRYQGIILKNVEILKDIRPPSDRIKGVREIKHIVIQRALIGGQAAINKFQQLQIRKKINAQYVVDKNQQKRVFESFIR